MVTTEYLLYKMVNGQRRYIIKESTLQVVRTAVSWQNAITFVSPEEAINHAKSWGLVRFGIETRYEADYSGEPTALDQLLNNPDNESE